MKSYTDLEQSKKLAEILPIESADMWLAERYKGQCMLNGEYIVEEKPVYYLSFVKPSEYNYSQDVIKDIPCWSLSALLQILPLPTLEETMITRTKTKWKCTASCESRAEYWSELHNNPIDACVELIIILHEQNII